MTHNLSGIWSTAIAIVYEPATDKRQTVTTVKCKRDESPTKTNLEDAFEFC